MARRPPPAGPSPPSLFDAARSRETGAGGAMPLAERVRPDTVHEVLGHETLVGEGRPLAEAIRNDALSSLILWGPPGSGKTTLARVIAASTRATFVPFSAVLGGVAEVRRIVDEARKRTSYGGGRTILFVDEIHRFNKSQQDAFLPHVEDGTIVLVGATTENPSFSITAPLLSRCTVYRLEPLAEPDIARLLARAVNHPRGLGGALAVDDDALGTIAAVARGDARRALNLLEACAGRAVRAEQPRLTAAQVRAAATEQPLVYDKRGEQHYNVVSAFIKSLRGSDPDAAIYWMMRMVDAGDDPLFVLRRLLIFASEDIGNADPRALGVAVDADQAFRRLGMPEGIYPMAQATIYLACAPKSNACTLAWHAARAAVREHGALPVPLELRNAPTKLMAEHGYGQGYRSPHDESGYAAGARYLPERLATERYYQPTEHGLEVKIAAWLERLRAQRR